MNTGSLAGACLCALLLPATALAQSDPRPLLGGHGNNVQAFITQHDDDRDGRITTADFAAFRRARFDATDRNHDGSVDEDEYVAEFRQRRQRALEQERRAQAAQGRTRFAALDADGDGQVSRAEFDAAGAQDWTRGQAALAAAAKDAPADRTQAFDRDGGRPGMPDSGSAEGFLALYDENGDGKVGRKDTRTCARRSSPVPMPTATRRCRWTSTGWNSKTASTAASLRSNRPTTARCMCVSPCSTPTRTSA